MSKTLSVELVSSTVDVSSDSQVFARFLFLEQNVGVGTDRDFCIRLDQNEDQDLCEIWRYHGAVGTDMVDGIRLTQCDDYLLTGLTLDKAPMDMCFGTRELYSRLLHIIKQRGYPHIVKAWNFIPGINHGEGDQEHYRQFCKGRAEAFDAAGLSGRHMPAGTGVGAPAQQGLGVFILASPKKSYVIENPRQMSAYHYPKQYGPRSPAFSRGTVVRNGSNTQLFLSGTAAIVGHESRHDGDIDAQTKEMLANVSALVSAAKMGPVLNSDTNGSHAVFRLYLRNPTHRSAVEQYLNQFLPASTQLVVLDADICRRELLVEIDGILTAGQTI